MSMAGMKKTLYVLHPGVVTSKSDGRPHNVDAGQLASLYGVSMDECMVRRVTAFERREPIFPPGAIHLYPRPDGNYVLPKQEATDA